MNPPAGVTGKQVGELRKDISELRSSMEERLDSIDGKLSQLVKLAQRFLKSRESGEDWKRGEA
ncbi:MAG: hypothetical protein OXI29_00100 [bacterium]|nr:hypothetical protein [bacterium]MDE2678121.1 hypothetical protein [Gemmatimonadota bacterium]